ncbi:endonuclease domain-containing protein [Streptomyces sp. NPDC002835]
MPSATRTAAPADRHSADAALLDGLCPVDSLQQPCSSAGGERDEAAHRRSGLQRLGYPQRGLVLAHADHQRLEGAVPCVRGRRPAQLPSGAEGVAYARLRERGPRAEDFLCAMCDPARPAAVWDHCHEHGLIRGPLCGSCNTMEGQGKDFLARKGSVRHLVR